MAGPFDRVGVDVLHFPKSASEGDHVFVYMPKEKANKPLQAARPFNGPVRVFQSVGDRGSGLLWWSAELISSKGRPFKWLSTGMEMSQFHSRGRVLASEEIMPDEEITKIRGSPIEGVAD